MRECRFFPWCSYIEDHGCTKDSCRHYQPMPDVDALLELADEMDAYTKCDDERCGEMMPPKDIHDYARRIREALGVCCED